MGGLYTTRFLCPLQYPAVLLPIKQKAPPPVLSPLFLNDTHYHSHYRGGEGVRGAFSWLSFKSVLEHILSVYSVHSDYHIFPLNILNRPF